MKPRTTIKKADWQKHEKDIAARSGGRRVPGSGNQPGRPGDVMTADTLREGKAIKGKAISISDAWLKKLCKEALCMNRVPVFEIKMEGASFPVPKEWVVIPALDFEQLTNRARPAR